MCTNTTENRKTVTFKNNDNKWTLKTEASSTMWALQRALVSVIITLLNDSARLLNKKMAAPSTCDKQIKSPIGWKSKRNTILPSVYTVPFHISTQRNIHRHSENRIWKYCVYSPSRKPIVLVAIFDFQVIHLSTSIASTCKHHGERLRSERKRTITLRTLALLNTPQVSR